MSQHFETTALHKGSSTTSSGNKLPQPSSPLSSPPSLLRSDSHYYSTLYKRRAKSHKHDTLLKWKIKPKNCLIVKKIHDEKCIYDTLDVALYLLSEKHTNVYFQEACRTEFEQCCKQKDTKDSKKNNIKSKSIQLLSNKFKQHIFYQNDKEIGNDIHLCIVLGGDGTLLYLVSLFRLHQHVPPIVCFQRGSLGFLAPFQMENYKEILGRILDETEAPAISVRMRLTARIWRHPDNFCGTQNTLVSPKPSAQGHKSHKSWSKDVQDIPAPLSPSISTEIKEEEDNNNDFDEPPDAFEIARDTDVTFAKTQNIFPLHSCNEIICHALNEVLIHRDNSASMMTANLWIDGDKCTTIQADGMIFSTPTGSTAYNISAGGSLISPTVQCIALTPICPHTLSFRPVIVSDETIIHIEIPKYARFNAIISFDGRNHITLDKGDVVEIIKCPYPVPTFKSRRFNVEWFQGLVSKFNWNLREMQQPFPDSINKDDDSKTNKKDTKDT